MKKRIHLIELHQYHVLLIHQLILLSFRTHNPLLLKFLPFEKEYLATRMYLFTFVKDTKELFMLETGNMQKCSIQDLVNAIKEINDYIAKAF